MYNVSKDYGTKIQELNRTFKLDIKIHHSDGELLITDEDVVGGSISYNESSQASEEFTIGGTVASDISFEILRNPIVDVIDFVGARVVVNIGLLLQEDVDTENYFLSAPQPTEFTEGDISERWEYVPLGVFNIDDFNKQRTTIQLTAIDNMIKLDKPYSESKLIYPATLYQIYDDVCYVGGVGKVNLSFPNSDYLVPTKPEGDFSLRDILSSVAELSGTFSRCNRIGNVELIWYKQTDVLIDPTNRFHLKLKEDIVQITGVSFETEEEVYLTGTDKYVVNISENPLLQGEYDIILPNILTNIGGTIFTPYECDWQGNPALQSGDMIRQLDVDGNFHDTLITSMSYKYRGKSTLKASGLSEISRGYRGSTDKKISEVKRKIKDDIDDKVTLLEQAILNATELITGNMGGYVVKRNGELLIMDTEDVITATKVWRWNLSGLGYSSNGVDGTYELAMTMDGSINAKFITSGDMSAERVKTGLIKSEDGSTWINLDTGYFNFKNRLKFDENGFSIDLTSDDIASIANINIILENENQSIGTDNYGATLGDRTLHSRITTFKGATRIESIIGELKLVREDGTTVIYTEENTGIHLSSVNPTATEDGSVTLEINNGVVLPSDNGYLLIPITIDGTLLNKKLSWSKVKDGSNVVIGTLSNNTHIVPTDKNGENGDYYGCSSTMNIYNGSFNDSSMWDISVVTNGVNGALVGKTYTVTNMLSDTGYVDFKATRTGYSDITLRFNISKSRKAIDGVDGSNGEDGYTPIKGVDYIDGKDGYIPIKGTDYFDGVDGDDGIDGKSNFLWVRYSENENGTPMVDTPTNAKHIGIATTSINIAPTDPLEYKWTLIKGTDGIEGDDGTNSYLHIKYSNDGGVTFTNNKGEDVGVWIGTLVNSIMADSEIVSEYTWNKVVGRDGVNSSSYWIIADSTIKKVKGEFNPSTIVIESKAQLGQNEVTNYYGRFIISEITTNSNKAQEDYFYNTSPLVFDPLDTNSIVKYTSSVDEARITYSPSSLDVKAIKVQLCKSGGTVTLVDEEKIYVIENGDNAQIVTIAPSNSSFVSESKGADTSKYVYTPSSIILNPSFQNCEFSKWQYSLNGTTWYNITSGSTSVTLSGENLIVPSNSSLYSNNQTFIIFKVISTTGEYDLITLSRVYNSVELAKELDGAIKQTSEYNGIQINAIDGFVATRFDGKARTVMNATSGILMQSNNGTGWKTNLSMDNKGDIIVKNITIDGTVVGDLVTSTIIGSRYMTSTTGKRITINESGGNDLKVYGNNGEKAFTIDYDTQGNGVTENINRVYLRTTNYHALKIETQHADMSIGATGGNTVYMNGNVRFIDGNVSTATSTTMNIGGTMNVTSSVYFTGGRVHGANAPYYASNACYLDYDKSGVYGITVRNTSGNIVGYIKVSATP